jgi:hypothetical protein
MEDGIYYIPVPAAGKRASVRFHNFSTGTNKEITSLKSVGRGLTVSPDLGTILTAEDSRTGSNVIVVDNFK